MYGEVNLVLPIFGPHTGFSTKKKFHQIWFLQAFRVNSSMIQGEIAESIHFMKKIIEIENSP